MQIRGPASPGIFNFQPATLRPMQFAPADAPPPVSDSASPEEVVSRLPDPKYDQTFDEATRITTALIAALNSGERVGMVLQEIV